MSHGKDENKESESYEVDGKAVNTDMVEAVEEESKGHPLDYTLD